jgi:hypothetical protein
MVVLAQVEDLADHLGAGGVGTDLGPVGAVPEPVQAIRVVASAPGVEHLVADAVGAAGQRDVAGDLLSMAQDRQASRGHPAQLLLGHGVSSLVGDPECPPSPSVLDRHGRPEDGIRHAKVAAGRGRSPVGGRAGSWAALLAMTRLAMWDGRSLDAGVAAGRPPGASRTQGIALPAAVHGRADRAPRSPRHPAAAGDLAMGGSGGAGFAPRLRALPLCC